MKRNLRLLLQILAFCLPPTLTAQVPSLAAGNTAFALNLYAELATNNSGNLFISPYSISTCLAMTYAGARGNTAAQMAQVLGFDTNQQQLASSFGQLQSQLEADQETNAIELHIANGLWSQAGFPFLPGFLQTASNQYQASLNQADFRTEAVSTTQAINDWVAQETQNKIQNMLSQGMITANTRLVLANAIYFLGTWTYAFAETNTSIEPFYLSRTNQVEAPLMHQPLPGPGFNYAQTSDLQAVELPYGSNQVSMVILLPTRIDGLRQLEQQLSPPFLSNLLGQMSFQSVEVFLPRFTNECYSDLTANLPQMGMPDAFTPNVADFSGMDGNHDLYLQFVVHKAWCQVDESGTEAAASTVGLTGASGGMPVPPIFRADHPFLFLIRDARTASLLFIGRMTNPTGSSGIPVPLPKLVLSQLSNGLTLSWPYPSTPWKLQQSPDLNPTNWTPTQMANVGPGFSRRPGFGGVSNDGTNYSLILPQSSGSLFFRLSQQ